MNDATAPAPPTATGRPRGPLRRALGVEWHQHRGLLAFHTVLALVLVLLAVLLEVRLGWVLILLAARLPADLADKRPQDGRMLRSSLGISRADAVRARVLVVTGGQLLLAIGAAWIILTIDNGPGAAHWSSFDSRSADLGPSPPTLWDHLVDIALWSGALLWAHALIGGEAFRLDKRPMGARAIALFLGACLLAYLVLTIAMLLTSYLLMTFGVDGIDGARFVAAAMTAQILTVVLTLGGGIAVLWRNRRRWVRRA